MLCDATPVRFTLEWKVICVKAIQILKTIYTAIVAVFLTFQVIWSWVWLLDVR